MPASMTGFGRGISKGRMRRYIVEVRSVNSRFCEVFIHAPKEWMQVEHLLYNKTREKFARGKFDLILKTEPVSTANREKNEERILVERWKKFERIRKKLKISEPVKLEPFLLAPKEEAGRSSDVNPMEAERCFLAAAEGAFRKLSKMRQEEGRELARDMGRRVYSMGRAVDIIEKRSHDYRPVRMEKMRRRVAELAGGVSLDQRRVETELALLVERADITEEVVRLKAHLRRLRQYLKGNGNVGRNIDFLIQEIHRETNTIGSKSVDLHVTGEVLFVKSEVEKIREQGQNLE